jgi:acyl dehydratase
MGPAEPGPAWDDISEGTPLPELRFPISLKTLMLELIGTRDFAPYHHNREYTRARGLRDIFTNTMFYQGLFARFGTDWSGPCSEIHSLDLRMLDQLCPGDVAVVTGHVAAKHVDADAATVHLDCRISDGPRTAARAGVVLAMPSPHFDTVRHRELTEETAVDVHPDMPEAARRELPRRTSRVSPYPVSEAQIGYFCEMARDANPRYTGAHPGGITAPPASLMIWCQGRAAQDGLDAEHPDVDLPGEPAWPYAQTTRPFDFRFPGTGEVIVQRVRSEYGVPIRPGDRLTATSGIVDCSPRRETKLGPGYFVTYDEVYRNQRGEIVGKILLDGLNYGARS